MKIIWNQVTKLSQIVAIILFIGIFCLGFFLGKKVGINDKVNATIQTDSNYRVK